MKIVKNVDPKKMTAEQIFSYMKNKYEDFLVDRYKIVKKDVAEMTDSHLNVFFLCDTYEKAGRIRLSKTKICGIGYVFDYCTLFYSNESCDMFCLRENFEKDSIIYVFYKGK